MFAGYPKYESYLLVLNIVILGKGRSKSEIGQKQAANHDPSKKAVSSIVSGENARKAT
jgi:hypothetical protein